MTSTIPAASHRWVFVATIALGCVVVTMQSCASTRDELRAPAPTRTGQAPSPSEKDARSPAEQKIDSQILYEIYRAEGTAAEKHVPPGETLVRVDPSGRALVELRADVTAALVDVVSQSGGLMVSTSIPYHSIVAWIPLPKIEAIAGREEVLAVVVAAQAIAQ